MRMLFSDGAECGEGFVSCNARVPCLAILVWCRFGGGLAVFRVFPERFDKSCYMEEIRSSCLASAGWNVVQIGVCRSRGVIVFAFARFGEI